MRRLRVHILTTNGPSRIQAITEEDSSVRSVMCLDGKAVALPVSVDYDAFVRTPTGIIQRFTGHPSYRVDVAAPVDVGRSWQLPLLIAHAAQRVGRFVAIGEEAADDLDVYATGEIDRDLRVLAVDHVAEKLAGLPADASGAIVLVPAGNDAPGGKGVDSAQAAAAALDMTLPPAASDPPWRRVGMFWRSLFGAVVLAGSAIAFYALTEGSRYDALYRDGRLLDLEKALDDARDGVGGRIAASLYVEWTALQRPNVDKAKIRINAEYAPPGGNCADKAKRLVSQITGTEIGRAAELCAVDAVVTSGSDAAVDGRLAYWSDGTAKPSRTLRGSKGAESKSWRLELDGPGSSGSRLRLVATFGPTWASGSQPWYRPLLAEPVGSEAWNAGKQRLSRLGTAVLAAEWLLTE